MERECDDTLAAGTAVFGHQREGGEGRTTRTAASPFGFSHWLSSFPPFLTSPSHSSDIAGSSSSGRNKPIIKARIVMMMSNAVVNRRKSLHLYL